MSPEVEQLKNILRNNGEGEGKAFSEEEADLLSKHYELVLKWNKRLHLTTLTQPREFFERHILESAFSESLILPSVNHIWDLGSGLGVPGMVIAILRPDLDVRLVEASRNKALFLEEVVVNLNLKNTRVIESRIEAIKGVTEESCLMIRAIEKMEKMIPEVLRLGAKSAQILIFGAKSIEERTRAFINDQRQMESLLIPGSNRRYLVNIFRSTWNRE
jgi:16S rRNA (guanine(527)-N(7))-methyltransferase RsmG